MNQTQPARAFRQEHLQERRFLAFATSLILVGALLLAPSSAWFAQAADAAKTVMPWNLTGNKGTNPATNFLGTTDNQPLVLRTNNVEVLRVLVGGNVGIGTSSPTVPLDVHGDVNTSTKYDLGGTTVLQASVGTGNTFVGPAAGQANTTGGANTAVGQGALGSDTTGINNTASGQNALATNISGSSNTASGAGALYLSTTGTANTASGQLALGSNTMGSNNSASGQTALGSNTIGNANTAVGVGAGVTGTTANANVSGSDNTFIGFSTGPGTPTQLTNATAIGANATVSASSALVLGGTGVNAVSVGIGTQTPQSTLQVVGNYVQLPTITGSAPPAADCATTADAGRMVVRTDGDTNLYICTGTSWVGK